MTECSLIKHKSLTKPQPETRNQITNE